MPAWRWVAGALLIGACGAGCLLADETPARPGEGAPGGALVTSPPQPAPPDTITAESRSVIRSLADVKRFALGVVGYEAVVSSGERLTLELSRRPDAVEAFTWLASQGTPVARLYAYWALRTLAPDRAGTYAASLETDSTMIKTVSGCIVSSHKVGSIAIRLKTPNDALGEPMPRP